MLQNVNISDEHLQLVSEAVANNSECNEKLAQQKGLKVIKLKLMKTRTTLFSLNSEKFSLIIRITSLRSVLKF